MIKPLKNIGIVGCGWLGIRLAQHLTANNRIYTTTTSEEKAETLTALNFTPSVINFDQAEDIQKNEEWKNLDCIIITVPFPRSKEEKFLERRCQQINSFLKGYQNQLFMMSTIGIYLTSEGIVSEKNIDQKSLNTKILTVENSIKTEFPQLNILRLAGLMGDDRYLSKYKISEPNQLANHIHYEDVIFIIEKMIHLEMNNKCYNLVAPEHPTKQQILDYQTQKRYSENVSGYGKKIISELLPSELNYAYKHPNPIYF